MIVLCTLSYIQCKEEVLAPVYELTLKARKSSVGETQFIEIKYKDATGAVRYLLEQSQNFEVTFPIQDGYNIALAARGVVKDAERLPDMLVGYEVVEIFDGKRTVLCNEAVSSASGLSSNYLFNISFNSTFQNQACK